MKKKSLSILLAICMILSAFPMVSFNASAEGAEFYAVFNTVEDADKVANTLSFYYDENKEVYEIFETNKVYTLPTEATESESWGYENDRISVENVVIDESVKNYTGLISTCYMFANMSMVTNLSGFEYLNVSNVKNMSNMFDGFASSSTSFNAVPDVSEWDTGKVENMSYMFCNFASSSSSFNAVPDVSKWDTGEVKNMSNMFNGFALVSKSITVVPDVSDWKTGSVVNMSDMFTCFAHENKETFNAVPDVSEWDTGSVTKMSGMFTQFAYESLSFDAVPDVSKWNTVNVEDMSSMFYEFAAHSTVKLKPLDLSGWKIENLEYADYMFYNYAQDLITYNVKPIVYGTNWNEGNSSVSAEEMFSGSALKGDTYYGWASADTDETGCFTLGYAITNEAKEKNKATNGGYVTVDKIAAKDATVTVSVTTNPSHNFEKVTIKDTNGTDVTTAVNYNDGTFTMPPYAVTVSAAFTLTNYVCFIDGDNDDVWDSDETRYETISGAIEAASENETTIVMFTDHNENITIPSTSNITLNLGGCTLTGDGKATVITNNGTLKLINGTVTGGTRGIEQNGTLTVGGALIVKGNTENLYLPEDKTFEISTVDGEALAVASDIGITTEATPVKETSVSVSGSAINGDETHFTSDKDAYCVWYNSDSSILELRVAAASITADDKTTKYATVQDAINAAKSGQTVKMLEDAEETIAVDIGNRNDNITLDLNGHILKPDETTTIIDISGLTFTLADTNPTATHTEEKYESLKGGILTGTTSDAVQVAEGATFNMYGGTIYGNSFSSAHAVNVKTGSTFNMYGGVISKNTSKKEGPGVYVDDLSTFNMYGGAITGNSTTYSMVGKNYLGGGVYNAGTFNMLGGEISGNTAKSNGGGVYNSGTMTVGGSAVIKNNIKGTTTVNNLYLASETIKISTETPLTSGADIGITLPSAPGQFTTTGNGTTADLPYFTSDNTAYRVAYNAGTGEGAYLELVATDSISVPSAVSSAKYYASLTLNENIDVNFKMSGYTEDFDITKLSVLVDGTPIELTENESDVTGKLKAVAPNNMSKDIHIVIVYDGVQVKNFNYTIRKYCLSVFNHYDSTSELYKLCEAVLNYGKYAEDYYNEYNGITGESTVNSDHANNFSSDDSINEDYTLRKKATYTGNYTNVTASLKLQSTATIIINVYTSETIEKDDIIIKDNFNNVVDSDNIACTLSTDGGSHYIIEISGIGATKLSREYTITLNGVDVSVFRVDFGAYDYCQMAQTEAGATDTLKTLCKAIYNYGEAALAYKATLN